MHRHLLSFLLITSALHAEEDLFDNIVEFSLEDFEDVNYDLELVEAPEEAEVASTPIQEEQEEISFMSEEELTFNDVVDEKLGSGLQISDPLEDDGDLEMSPIMIDSSDLPHMKSIPISETSSVPATIVHEIASNDVASIDVASIKASLNTLKEERIELGKVFKGAPLIYSLLILLSMASFALAFYVFLTVRGSCSPQADAINQLKTHLSNGEFDQAKTLCKERNELLFKMLLSGIAARGLGRGVITEAVDSEGSRLTSSIWHKMSLLGDVSVVAPMLGLLGTVLGMFYAFYGLNRTSESVASLFDGLGISVGTTVAGLGVAIFAMVLHSLVKFQLVKAFAHVEHEAKYCALLIDKKDQ